MRALLVPELYRPDAATANGTLNDLVTLAEEWLDRDPSLHVYWLLPPRDAANYDASYVLADRPRVTLIEAEPFMHGDDREDAFSETGHSEAEFRALRREIHDAGGYVDVVVDQLVTGRYDLYKWLLELGGHRDADVRPVHLVGNVHDLRLPFKRHGAEYPDGTPAKRELLSGAVTDGLWFKAGVDADRMREYGSDLLTDSALDDLLSDAVQTGSPIDFSEFEESYASEPEWLHVAGSGWGKKNVDDVLDVGETLYDRFGIRTLMTNMDPILDAFADREFVEPYPEADRDAYERALENGDIAICASDHETMARTPFEQAASGQVLVARDRPWIHDCVPDDYRLLGDLSDLESLAVRAVEHWEEAVEANRRLVAHVERVRDPERCGERTHADLRARVDSRVRAYDLGPADDPVRDALDEFEDGTPVPLDELDAAAAAHTADGRPATDRDGYARTDLVYALRSLGYRDTGAPGAPAFAPRNRQSARRAERA